MWGRSIALTIVAATIAACATISLRTADAPTNTCDLALVSGILTNNRPNGLALREPDGQVVLVLWPFGYSSRGFVGSMELVDATGKSVAREGDPVQMSGGTNGDGVFVACGGSVVKVQPQG
jgi:hypothetical protein